MTTSNLCRTLDGRLGSLFSCAPHGRDERVHTPFLYPDGDSIDLFVQTKDGISIVSDLGETLRWLRSQTLSPRRTPKQDALIADACVTHGVELFKGMLVARCKPGDSVAAVILRVAQACLRISDLWFTFRTRAVESVNDEVGDFLAERQLPFERRPKLVGRSGRGWTVDFHVLAPAHGSLVSVLSTGSRSTARAVAEHVLAAWFDLNHFSAGPEALHFVSLFDDTADVWSPEDFVLLEPLSTVTRWSQPDVFADVLAEAM